MRTRARTRTAVAGLAVAAAVAVVGLVPTPAQARSSRPDVPQSAERGQGQRSSSYADLYVLDDEGTLSRRSGRVPAHVYDRSQVRGLNAGDRLVGLDTRPATGELYALGRSGQLYTLDARSGRATPVGSPVVLQGTAVGLDFNPTVDLIRVVTDQGQNLRVRPADGTLAGTDTPLAYAPGDRFEGRAPQVTGAGYTNSVAGATTTALYGIDSNRDTLVLQGTLPGAMPAVSPNTGQLFTVGWLGVDVKAHNGFDIIGPARGATFDHDDYIAVVAVDHQRGSSLKTLDLETGRVTDSYPIDGKVVALTASLLP